MPHGITQCYLPPGRGDTPDMGVLWKVSGHWSVRYVTTVSQQMSAAIRNVVDDILSLSRTVLCVC